MLGQEVEVAGEDVEAFDIWFEEGRDGEGNYGDFDGVEGELADHVIIERREGQVRDGVETVGDADGVGDEVVVGANELRISGARAGVGEGGGKERAVDGDIEGEQCGERAAETVSADGDGGDGALEGRGRHGLGYGA